MTKYSVDLKLRINKLLISVIYLKIEANIMVLDKVELDQ